MNLQEQYKKETGNNAYDNSNECEGISTGNYYTKYVEWLEQKLVENLNMHCVSVPKGTVCRHKWQLIYEGVYECEKCKKQKAI